MNDHDLVLALDQSTAATKAAIFDAQGKVLSEIALPHDSVFPEPGWVEQDPEVLWAHSQKALATMVQASTDLGNRVLALGISNQRETVVVWNRQTGKAVYPALGWQCVRGHEMITRWRSQGLAEPVLESTGLPLDPHFSASKIAWVLENVPGARRAADRGELVFGTVDSWLVFRLTGGKVHATDPSNASRTLLYNLRLGQWDESLFQAFNIPKSMAPEIRMSDTDFGTATLGGLSQVPIRAILGDSHAALFGLGCFEPGQAKATYGTGSSVMLNLGPDLPTAVGGLVATSVAWGLRGQISFVLEGNIHHSGDTLRWLIKDLGLFTDFEDWQTRADRTPSNGGVYLVPAFSGLGAPYWDEQARGAFVGLVRGTTKDHVARAGLESLAYQVVDLLEAMRTVSGMELKRLAVDGGPTKNPALMQFQADVGRVAVEVNRVANASLFGVACLTGLSAGVWTQSDLKALSPQGVTYVPQMPQDQSTGLVAGWKTAVGRTRG